MENYLILINKESKPVVIEVPEKPEWMDYLEKEKKGKYSSSCADFDSPNEEYNVDLQSYETVVQSAIADESKHIHFKEDHEHGVLCRILGFVSWEYGSVLKQRAKEVVGQTFQIPEGYSLRFEECEKPCCQTCLELGYCGQRTAYLEKQEPKPANSAHSFTEGADVEYPLTREEKIPGIVRFLCGECEFKGVWFGDPNPPGETGNFWWRKYLRELFEDK